MPTKFDLYTLREQEILLTNQLRNARTQRYLLRRRVHQLTLSLNAAEENVTIYARELAELHIMILGMRTQGNEAITNHRG